MDLLPQDCIREIFKCAGDVAQCFLASTCRDLRFYKRPIYCYNFLCDVIKSDSPNLLQHYLSLAHLSHRWNNIFSDDTMMAYVGKKSSIAIKKLILSRKLSGIGAHIIISCTASSMCSTKDMIDIAGQQWNMESSSIIMSGFYYRWKRDRCSYERALFQKVAANNKKLKDSGYEYAIMHANAEDILPIFEERQFNGPWSTMLNIAKYHDFDIFVHVFEKRRNSFLQQYGETISITL